MAAGMTAPDGSVDVLVAGGGVIGLAIAWRVAQAGLSVTLWDPEPGRGSSWAAAGMLAPVTEVHYGEEALLRLNLASSARWPSFAAELEEASGQRIGYRQCGALLVARDRDDLEAFSDVHAFQQRLGLKARRLRSDEARDLEPGLAPSTRGAILVEGDHQVDNRALVAALQRAAERSGVTLRRTGVAAVQVQGEQVEGVKGVDGTHVSAGVVVIAAGWGSAQIEGLPPRTLPVRPVKGQLVHVRHPGDLAVPRLADRLIRGLEVYVVPREDGRAVVGATMEERGADTTVTAGAVLDLLRRAWELLPGITEYELVECVAGLRPASPDNAPLLGATGVDGVLAAAGHFRNGILLTPVTADAIATLVLTGSSPPEIDPFSPRRFEPVEA